MQVSAVDPAGYLRSQGERGEGPFDIARMALMLAALDHKRRPIAPYDAHLDEIAKASRDMLRLVHRAEDAAHALSALLGGRFGYDGDRRDYDDPQNADLMAVIERRRGLPVSLGILYIHAARAGGLKAQGLNTPAHFLLRIAAKESAVLIDPFNGGATVDSERLGAPPVMATTVPGETALGDPVSDADVLLRLQNNIKLRAFEAGNRARALEIAERMALIAPARAELWFDLARLREAGDALGAAKAAYETCLALAKPGTALHNEAAIGLAGLKRRLN